MMTPEETAGIKLIREAGFTSMADEVESGRQTLNKTLDILSKSRMSGEYRLLFAAALQAIGGFQPDMHDIRRYVEGRTRRVGDEVRRPGIGRI